MRRIGSQVFFIDFPDNFIKLKMFMIIEVRISLVITQVGYC